MPPLASSIHTLKAEGDWHSLYAGWNLPRRSPMPADGNSGGEGCEQDYRDDMTIGAAAYQGRDPQFAGQLMHVWRAAGKPILDGTHPVLTLLTLHPALASVAPPEESRHRQSLGIISKARRADGTPLYALFRAGHCTHHMDFDQGNLHLAFGDAVL